METTTVVALRNLSSDDRLAAARAARAEHPDLVDALYAPACDRIDVVILAGDIDVKGRGVAFARRFPCPVVYVPGNHEYCGGAIPRLTVKLKEAAAGSNVHVLDCDSVVIGGTRFLGAATRNLTRSRTPQRKNAASKVGNAADMLRKKRWYSADRSLTESRCQNM